MNGPLRKELKALAGTIAENTVRAVASTCGYPDRSGDVIMPGAFGKAALNTAKSDGWLDVTHEWELPIGYITDAKMVGDELHMEATFHSTQEAQDVRTVVKERMDAGRSVSVSIGFMPDYEQVKYFNSGAELLKWAEEAAYDMTRLDTKAIKKLSYCRVIPAVVEVFEFSICPVGMHPKAKVTEAKNLPAEQQFNEALDAFVASLEREADIAEMRSRVSDAQKERLAKAVDVLETLFKSEPAPEPVTDADPIPAHLRIQRMRLASGL